jgi:acyl-CoA thioester hydrolase
MSFKFSRDFRVRYSECDGYGHLNNANYLRYAHETTIEAFASAGYDPGKYPSQQHSWLASEVFIDFKEPFRFDEIVEVQSSLVNLSAFHMLWEFSYIKPGSARSYSHAKIKYGFIDTFHQQFSVLPAELINVLEPEDIDGAVSAQIEFPVLASQPAGAFTRNWLVAWRDVTPDNTLHIAAYLDYLLDFALQTAADCGWTFKRVSAEGFACVVRRKWLKIFEPAKYGDELVFSTWNTSYKLASVTRQFALRRASDQLLLGEAHTLWVCVDRKTGRPIRLPPSWKEDFASQSSLD